jgi:hypothetical protein
MTCIDADPKQKKKLGQESTNNEASVQSEPRRQRPLLWVVTCKQAHGSGAVLTLSLSVLTWLLEFGYHAMQHKMACLLSTCCASSCNTPPPKGTLSMPQASD